jgi:hypothetical protein
MCPIVVHLHCQPCPWAPTNPCHVCVLQHNVGKCQDVSQCGLLKAQRLVQRQCPGKLFLDTVRVQDLKSVGRQPGCSVSEFTDKGQ